MSEGIRGLYRGLGITIIRDAPAHAIYFSSYEYTREYLHPGCRKTGEESLSTMLMAGGIAGVASWVSCYPLDVLKSRLQGQGGSGIPDKYTGILDCMRKSVQEEGMSVLWRGLGTAVTRAYLVNGAIFSAYELSLRFMPSEKKVLADCTIHWISFTKNQANMLHQEHGLYDVGLPLYTCVMILVSKSHWCDFLCNMPKSI